MYLLKRQKPLTKDKRNPDGFMQWAEFMELQKCLLAWHNMFRRHDTDGSGYIESHELGNVIQQFGTYFLLLVCCCYLTNHCKIKIREKRCGGGPT
jgi:hypothetical protein